MGSCDAHWLLKKKEKKTSIRLVLPVTPRLSSAFDYLTNSGSNCGTLPETRRQFSILLLPPTPGDGVLRWIRHAVRQGLIGWHEKLNSTGPARVAQISTFIIRVRWTTMRCRTCVKSSRIFQNFIDHFICVIVNFVYDFISGLQFQGPRRYIIYVHVISTYRPSICHPLPLTHYLHLPVLLTLDQLKKNC